jgi:hypothetical protein
MKKVELNNIFDKEVWVSDNRVAALVSKNAVKQIDYHGLQPVSRNACIFNNENFVIKTFIKIGSNKKKQLKWNSLEWYPNKIETSFNINGFAGTLHISLSDRALLIWISSDDIIDESIPIRFEIVFNKKSLTKNVQGARTYSLIDKCNDRVIYRINDKILLNSWMKRTGAYNGDFMIPESWRRMIFINRKVSGLAKYNDLKNEYKNDNLVLYNENVFVIFGGNGYTKRENSDTITFQYEYDSRIFKKINVEPFCITFGDDLANVKNNYSEILKNGLKLIYKKKKEYQSHYKKNPEIFINCLNSMEQFFKLFPVIVKSAEITDLKMFRACSSSYYWLWAWDSMVTANSLSYCGMNEDQKKVIEFVGSNRNYDGAIPMQWSRRLEPMDAKKFGTLDFLFANLIMHQFVVDSEHSIIHRNYPQMVYSFDKIYESCNTKGMFQSVGMYPDLPLKLGRTEKSYVSMEAGAAYSYSIIMNQLSTIMNDPITIRKSEKLIYLIQKNFLSYFYDIKREFIIDSINEKHEKKHIYALYSLLFLINSCSFSIIRPKLREIGNFIENNLLGNSGIALVPEWDECRRSEDAMSSWYPYWDLPALKIFRRLNNSAAIIKWLNVASECFEYFGYCPEYVSLDNLSNDKGSKWVKHGTPWNLNCSAGWYQCIIETVFGIEEDIGGITYIPMDPITDKMKMSNIYLKGVKSEIEISGSGKYVSSFIINGRILKGCMKIPEIFYSNEKLKIGIFHSDEEPALFFKELNGAIVKDVIYSNEKVQVLIESFGFLDVLFYSRKKAELLIDNEAKKYIWYETEKEGQVSIFLKGRHKISISNPK